MENYNEAKATKCRAASEQNSPPKLGGVAAPLIKMPRSHLIKAQTGWFLQRASLQIASYFGQDALEIFEHIFIFKSNNANVKLLEELRPLLVCLRSGLRHMPCPI